MRKNPIVTRVIKKEGNKSTYYLNGGQSAAKVIQHLANTFNIQIDNLCQFLPQDKVVEFAQMSPIELLASTQRAVAGPELTKMHEDLKKIRSSQSNFMHEDKEDRDHLANLESRQEMQRTEVERMRERAIVKKRLERLEKCRPMVRYYEAKTNFLGAKQRAKDTTKELKQLRATAAPTLRKLDAKKEYEAKARALKIRKEKELNASERECDREAKAIADAQDAIRDCEDQIEAEKKGVAQKREDLKRQQAKLVDLKRKKAEPPEQFDSRAMNDAIQELRRQQRALDEQMSDLDSRKNGLKDQGNARKRRINELTSQLQGLETQAGQQENKLEKLSRETFRAWKWIQDNQEKFSEHVYGPPIVECSLKNPSMADAVESLLQENDFKFITVQNNADFALLQRKLFQDLKLHDVSLRVCSSNDLGQFRPPLNAEEMERFGLGSWTLDHIQGPETVLAMLCHERSLHRSAISTRELSQQQHDELAKTTVQSYVGGRKSYQFLRRAEYGSAGTSARVRDVRAARMWTDQPVDVGIQARLQREINETKGEAMIIKSEFDDIKRQIEQLKEKKEGIGGEIETRKLEKDALQNALMQWKALDLKIQDCEDKIGELQERLGGVRTRIRAIKEQQDAAVVDKTDAILQFAATTRDIKVKSAALLEAEVLHLEALSDFEVLKAQNDEIVQTISRKDAEQTEADTFYRQEYERALALLEQTKALRAEGERLLEEEGDGGLMEIVRYVGDAVKTEENLNAEIDAEKAKLELTEGGSTGIIKEFEDRAKVIDRLRAKVESSNTRQEDFKHAIRQIRSKWEPRLEEIVARINDAFSDSFARIGCAGQVAIYKSSSEHPADIIEENGGVENGLDFANWAVHISVKFREREPLSLLDSHRQSGGERAVSTIFYLMALQSLSRAPFRVVDEINQGMDPRNERMVHGRMVDIAAEDGGSQYFLITPKLLSGLKYRRGMTVLCIVSGENMPAAGAQDDEGNWVDGPKVDFREFVKQAQQLGYGHMGLDNGRRVDSDVPLGRSVGMARQLGEVGA